MNGNRMTTAIYMRHKDHAILAADTRLAGENGALLSDNASKFIDICGDDGSVVGRVVFSGSVATASRMISLLPILTNNEPNVRGYLTQQLYDLFAGQLDLGVLPIDLQCTMLVLLDTGRAFHIMPDFSVLDITQKDFVAIGSGAPYAIGAYLMVSPLLSLEHVVDVMHNITSVAARAHTGTNANCEYYTLKVSDAY